MSRVIQRAADLRARQTIIYPAFLRTEHDGHRDELRVVGFSEHGVLTKRLDSDDATVYTVFNRQLQDNGVYVLAGKTPHRPTRSEHSLEGAAVNGLTPVGQEAASE